MREWIEEWGPAILATAMVAATVFFGAWTIAWMSSEDKVRTDRRTACDTGCLPMAYRIIDEECYCSNAVGGWDPTP